ncbi:MAG: hypothetical protein O2960_20410 [Verrucomicrobia bacterium]|nr:hypothetical protein [Verrucomicrobiota bacterium]
MTVSEATHEGAAVRHIREFCERCDRLTRRQYHEIILATPAGSQFEEHRYELKWLLRTAEALRTVASDPEFPNPSLRQRLDAAAWKMEETWQLLYNPPSPEETEQLEKLIGQTFPDEPRA